MNILPKAGLLAAIALSLCATNCPSSQNDVNAILENGIIVSYSLVQRCGTLASGPANTTDLGSGRRIYQGPFLVYEIRSILNNGRQPANFRFDSSRLRLESGNGRRHTGFGSEPRMPVTIAPATEWSEGGRVIVKLADAGPVDPRLVYARAAADPPVMMMAGVPSYGERGACPIDELPALPNI